MLKLWKNKGESLKPNRVVKRRFYCPKSKKKKNFTRIRTHEIMKIQFFFFVQLKLRIARHLRPAGGKRNNKSAVGKGRDFHIWDARLGASRKSGRLQGVSIGFD